MSIVKTTTRGLVHYFSDSEPYQFDAWVNHKTREIRFLLEDEHEDELESIKEDVFKNLIDEGYEVNVTIVRW